MEEEKSHVESFGLHLKDYVETQSRIAMLTAGSKAAEAAAGAFSGAVLGLVGLFFLAFLSFTAAFWLGDLFGNYFAGFLVVSLFYLLTGIVLYLNQEAWLRMPVLNGMIKSFFKNWDDGKN